MELEPDLQDSIGVIVGDGSFDVELDLCIVDTMLVISIVDILTELVSVIDIVVVGIGTAELNVIFAWLMLKDMLTCAVPVCTSSRTFKSKESNS